MTRIYIEADIPNELLTDFLQAIRSWESQHTHVQIGVKLASTDLSTRSAEAIFNQMDPPFPFVLKVPSE